MTASMIDFLEMLNVAELCSCSCACSKECLLHNAFRFLVLQQLGLGRSMEMRQCRGQAMRLSIFTKGGLHRTVNIQLIMSNQFKSYHINSYHVCVTVTFDILHGFRNINYPSFFWADQFRDKIIAACCDGSFPCCLSSHLDKREFLSMQRHIKQNLSALFRLKRL